MTEITLRPRHAIRTAQAGTGTQTGPPRPLRRRDAGAGGQPPRRADENKDHPTGRYVLLHEAADLATQAGNVELALEAIGMEPSIPTDFQARRNSRTCTPAGSPKNSKIQYPLHRPTSCWTPMDSLMSRTLRLEGVDRNHAFRVEFAKMTIYWENKNAIRSSTSWAERWEVTPCRSPAFFVLKISLSVAALPSCR